MVLVILIPGYFLKASSTPRTRSPRLNCPGMVITTTFPLPRSNSPMRLPLSWPARKLSVPTKRMRLDSGESRSEERRVGKECRSGWEGDHDIMKAEESDE